MFHLPPPFQIRPRKPKLILATCLRYLVKFESKKTIQYACTFAFKFHKSSKKDVFSGNKTNLMMQIRFKLFRTNYYSTTNNILHQSKKSCQDLMLLAKIMICFCFNKFRVCNLCNNQKSNSCDQGEALHLCKLSVIVF